MSGGDKGIRILKEDEEIETKTFKDIKSLSVICKIILKNFRRCKIKGELQQEKIKKGKKGEDQTFEKHVSFIGMS